MNKDESYTECGRYDFNEDKSILIKSYVFRILSLIVFGVIFSGLLLIRNDVVLSIDTFFTIKIENVSVILSFVLIVLDVIAVIYLHELIHASVFYLTIGSKPYIGIRGFVIFAGAPGKLNKKPAMIINGLAPFTVISLLGMFSMAFVSVEIVPWIFIPTLVNAAAAAGDFMIVSWIINFPNETLFEDMGDALVAYSGGKGV